MMRPGLAFEPAALHTERCPPSAPMSAPRLRSARAREEEPLRDRITDAFNSVHNSQLRVGTLI